MALAEREIEVRKTKYKFNLIGGISALKALQRITGKMSALLPDLISKDPDKINSDFYNIITDEYDVLFETFVDKHQLFYKDKSEWKAVNDLDEHFSGQPTAMVELLYKIIIENDKDFFHSLPTLIDKGVAKITEKLLANSLPMQEGVEKTLNNMTNVANNLKESLG